MSKASSNLVPVIAALLIAWVIIIIPFKIIGYGFLPPDDAMRHAAKAVSGKPWSDLLVLRDDYKMDSHAGWHAILGFVHKLTSWDTHSLVIFSVTSLFILFSLVPVTLLRYPEAWPLTLITIAVAYPSVIFRLLLGRPYIVAMSVIMVLGFTWQRLKDGKFPYGAVISLSLLIALSTWIHCGWYLFAIPLLCIFLAREWLAGIRFTISCVIGVAVGALLTGHPILFLKQTLQHVFLAFGNNELQRMLVGEFQPFGGEFFVVLVVILILMWRSLRGKWDPKVIDNPVFILMGLSWSLGFFTRRAWIDFGVAATLCWIAQEFQEYFRERMPFFSWKRLGWTVIFLGILFASFTSDVTSRWSETKPKDYLSLGNKEQLPWLPGAGGIVYSDTMDVFYQTFYENPNAPWRYVLGFEPGIMPSEDLSIYRNIQLNYRSFNSFEPWVKKMKPHDRLIVRHVPGEAPKISGLEWNYAAYQIWIGRLPRKK